MSGGCAGCRHRNGKVCERDGVHQIAYETKYTDSDFCGPDRRYYEPLTRLDKIRRLFSS